MTVPEPLEDFPPPDRTPLGRLRVTMQKQGFIKKTLTKLIFPLFLETKEGALP
jgi:hypothetical protein